MGAIQLDKDALLLLNDVPGTSVDVKTSAKIAFMIAKRVKSESMSLLVLGAKGDEVGKNAREFLGNAGFNSTKVIQTDVAFPTKNSDPIVNENAPIQDLFLDTTKKFTVGKRGFDLVLGRAIVCLCGTNLAGGPCGFPALVEDAPKFLRRVGKSLTPGGIAYLHGDKFVMTPKAYLYWQAAKVKCESYSGKGTQGKDPDWFTVDLVLNEKEFVGLKVTRGKADTA